MDCGARHGVRTLVSSLYTDATPHSAFQVRPYAHNQPVRSPLRIMSSSENKELLGKMFSSFVARKTRLASPPPPITPPTTLPALTLRSPPPIDQRDPKRSRPAAASRSSPRSSHVSASMSGRMPEQGESSVRPIAKSQTSVEAIATDATSVPKPFHCEKCSSAFRQRSQLSRHFLRVHERRKPFACAHCDKCFASAFDRKRHVEAVHGRRCIEFFCDRCQFRSKEQQLLTAHIRATHERDQCRQCGKVFKRPANLLAHERHYHSR